MKHHKLRIAWSVAWGIAFLLLVALWVRSYWWADFVHCPLQSPRNIFVQSYIGRMIVYLGAPSPNPKVILPSGLGRESIAVSKFVFPHGPDPHWYFTSGKNGVAMAFPHWFLTLMLASISTVPWLPWRFTLRTLLIAMTLVAVVLGAIVWASR
jgi:hypothetical protein